MEAIGAAGGDPRIIAVVAEGATRRSAADLAWLPAEHGVFGAVELAINWLQTGITDLLTDMAPPVPLGDSVAAATGTRFLLVQADNGEEIACAAFIDDGAPERVSTWVVPGAGHARGLQTAPEEWTTRVVGFLSDVLLEASLAR